MSLKSWITGIINKPKIKNISEPTLKLIRLFKENPKRFKFKYSCEYNEESYLPPMTAENSINGKYADLSVLVFVTDNITQECFKYSLRCTYDVIDHCHGKKYLVTEYILCQRPGWMTTEEIALVEKVLKDYFTDRVNRYKNFTNRCEERAIRDAQKDKDKERKRLVDIYKGE